MSLRHRTSRRRLIQSAAAGAGALALYGRPDRAQRIRAMQDTFDWKRFSGSEVHLILNKHPYTESLLPLIPEFQELTGITVPEPLIMPEGEFFEKLRLDLSTGAGEFDVFMTGPETHWAYDDAGWTEPLDPFLADTSMTSPDYDVDDLFPNLMNANRWNLTLGSGIGEGNLWAIPVMVETYAQVYRYDVYQELGIEPGKTIEEWRDANKKATSDTMKGIIVRGSRGDGITGTGFISIVRGYGGRDFDENLECQINSPEGVHVAEQYCASVKESGPTGWANVTWYEGQESFANGSYAQYTDCDFFTALYEDPDKSQVVGKVGLAPVPHAPDRDPFTHLWTWALGMSTKAHDKNASWFFIQWATMKDQLLNATVKGQNYNPTRASVFNDPAVQKIMGNWGNGTYLPTVVDNLSKYAHEGWTPEPENVFLTTRWDQALQDIWSGEPAQSALDKAKAEIDAHMKDAGLLS
jgi:multiple sugar transport system substrate-binding protein